MFFTTERVINQGGYGKVYKGNDEGGREIAVKEIFIGGCTPEKMEKTLKEAEILSSLKHPCVIRYFGHDVRDSYLYISMEYAPYGTLKEMIEEKQKTESVFRECDIVDMFAQIVHAVVYIHEKGVIHRDIHADNVLRGEGYRLKLCDFGISRRLKSELTEGLKGHTSCWAPELIGGGKNSKETDLWSMGCLLYHLTALKPPFESESIAGRMAAVLSEQSVERLFLGFPSTHSNLLKDLTRSLLAKNPKRRPTAVSLTSHPLLVKAIHTVHLKLPPIEAPPSLISSNLLSKLKRASHQDAGSLS